MKRQAYYDYTDVSPYREVSLSRLFLRVLRFWRILLLAGVAGGLLLGGFQVLRYHSRRDSINEKRAAYEQDREVYESARRSYQEEINELEDTINQRQNYVRDSVLMQIDAQNTGLASVVFSVRVPELENDTEQDDAAGISRMNDLVRTFCSIVQDGAPAENAAAQTGIGATDLKELVKASYEESPRQVSTSSNNQTTLQFSDQVTGLFTVTVRAMDEGTADKILELYQQALEKQAEDLKKTAGEFTLLTLSRNVTTAVDNELMTYQNLKFAEIYTLQNNLNNKQKFLLSLSKPSFADAYSGRTLLKTGIKYGVVGFIAAAVLLMFLLGLYILVSGKILSGAEIDRKYGFKNLVVFGEESSKKALAPDRLIRRLEYGGDAPDPEKACDLLFSRIRNIVGDRKAANRTAGDTAAANSANANAAAANTRTGAGSGRYTPAGIPVRSMAAAQKKEAPPARILLTGGVSDRVLRWLQKSLEERAENQESSLNFSVLQDPARHPASLSMLRECTGVVLVEELGTSAYRDVLRTVDLVDDTGKPVIGTVYF